VLLLFAVALLGACGKQPTQPEPVRAVRTLVVAPGAAAHSHEYAGEIRARVESRLGFRVPGKLLQREVSLGQSVKAGQVLARLDSRDLLLARGAAEAQAAAARSARDQASSDYKRFVELQRKGFISAAELERRESAFKATQAQLDQALAQVDAQGNQTSYAQLISDVPGVVTSVDAEPGTVLLVGQPVVRVAVDGPRDVVFSVPEHQLAGLRTAAARPGGLKVRLWGREGALPAQLRELAAAADPVTRTFLVKADVGNAEVKLGQTATVVLDLQVADGVIKLPSTALTEQGGKSVVWLLDPAAMTVKPVPVKVAGAVGNDVVIAAGLAAGQEVVIAGVHVLTPGQAVKRYQPPRGGVAVPAAAASR
jgi:membrane fusion protein, multidrug efflux system